MNLAGSIRLDCENGLPSLRTITTEAIKRPAARHRLAQAEAMLVERPGDPVATELFLLELFSRTLRQVKASLSLHSTFAQAVEDIDPSTLKALPEHTRLALLKLADIARREAVRIAEPRGLAHALTIDGATVEALLEDTPRSESPSSSLEATYRRLAMQHHPDREGGSTEAMQAINEMYEAMKRKQA